MRRVLALLCLSFLGLGFLTCRNSYFDTPTYASDEYAYLMLGKFYHQHAELFSRDAWLQRLPNALYFAIVHIIAKVTSHPEDLCKLLNALSYTLAGTLLAAVLLRMSGLKLACGFLLLYFLIPWSGYTASIQPEVLAYFGVVVIGLCAVTAVWARSFSLCGLAGFLAVTAFSIKPTVAGPGVATLVFLGIAYKGREGWGGQLGSRIAAVICFAISAYFGAIVWAGLLDGNWRWVPQFVSGHYAGELAARSGSRLDTLGGVLTYGLGLSTALVVLVPHGLTSLAAFLERRDTAGAATESESVLRRALAQWVALATCVSILFVAYYSVKTGMADSLGRRLHLRYLGWVLPFLLFFTILGLDGMNNVDNQKRRRWWLRVTALTLFIGLLLWLTFVERRFRIYPWDSPELSAFYTSANTYWREAALLSFRLTVLATGAVVVIVLALAKRWSSYALILYMVLLLAAGNFNNTAFQVRTKRELGILTADARSLARDNSLTGPGLVVGSDRYGPMSYVLYGIAQPVAVQVKKQGGEVTQNEVPIGTRWILFVEPFVPKFEFSAVSDRGHLRLYRRD